MSRKNETITGKYTKDWFVQILSDSLNTEKKLFESVTIYRVKNRMKIGYQSWRPRFLINLPSEFSADLSLPSKLYAKDDVREEEFAAHSKIWNSFNNRKGQASFLIPKPICFCRHSGTDRGILISEAVKGNNLNDLLYLALIPGGGFFLSNKVHRLLFRAGQGFGEYRNREELMSGTLQDNIDLAYETIFLMPEFSAEGRKIVEKFLNQLPRELLNSRTILAIDYLPRNLMYSGQNLFFVDLDPLGFRHPSYIGERFIYEMMNKMRYPGIKTSKIMDFTKSFRDGIYSVWHGEKDATERKILQVLGSLLYLRELERSRQEYWVNGANRFWMKYIKKMVNDLMISFYKLYLLV